MQKIILAITLAAATLTGCAGLSEREQRIGSGAVIGGAAGNLLGGGTIGTVGGAVLGGLVGSEIDKNNSKHRDDKRYDEARRRYDECRQHYSRQVCNERRY